MSERVFICMGVFLDEREKILRKTMYKSVYDLVKLLTHMHVHACTHTHTHYTHKITNTHTHLCIHIHTHKHIRMHAHRRAENTEIRTFSCA